MAKLEWDKIGERFYETGVRNCVLYVRKPDGSYDYGVAWNGLTSVTEAPEGGEASDIYADDIKYLTLRSAENFKGSLEAYTYPDEFNPCEGIVFPIPGVLLGQQPYREFSICYRTTKGNDTELDAYGYKLHIVYNCLSSPTDKSFQTKNDSPEAVAFTWDISSIPVLVDGHKPSSILIIDSTKVSEVDLSVLEELLYGSDYNEPTLLMPDEIATVFRVGYLLNEDRDYILFGGDRICV